MTTVLLGTCPAPGLRAVVEALLRFRALDTAFMLAFTKFFFLAPVAVLVIPGIL